MSTSQSLKPAENETSLLEFMTNKDLFGITVEYLFNMCQLRDVALDENANHNLRAASAYIFQLRRREPITIEITDKLARSLASLEDPKPSDILKKYIELFFSSLWGAKQGDSKKFERLAIECCLIHPTWATELLCESANYSDIDLSDFDFLYFSAGARLPSNPRLQDQLFENNILARFYSNGSLVGFENILKTPAGRVLATQVCLGDGMTILHKIVSARDRSNFLQKYLQYCPEFVDAPSSQGTPLRLALESMSYSNARLLLLHGANPDILGPDERSPFSYYIDCNYDDSLLECFLNADIFTCLKNILLNKADKTFGYRGLEKLFEIFRRRNLKTDFLDILHDHLILQPPDHELVKICFRYSNRALVICCYKAEEELRKLSQPLQPVLFRGESKRVALITDSKIEVPKLIADFEQYERDIQAICKVINGNRSISFIKSSEENAHDRNAHDRRFEFNRKIFFLTLVSLGACFLTGIEFNLVFCVICAFLCVGLPTSFGKYLPIDVKTLTIDQQILVQHYISDGVIHDKDKLYLLKELKSRSDLCKKWSITLAWMDTAAENPYLINPTRVRATLFSGVKCNSNAPIELQDISAIAKINNYN